MNPIKSSMTRTEAASAIVKTLKNHYLCTESDVVIGFNSDGEVDFDYASSNNRSVEVVYFATNNGFTFNLDEDPTCESFWADESEHGYLADYIADELKNLEFDDLIEFA